MRIPFDLIAAVLCLEAISRYLMPSDAATQHMVSWETALPAWGAFLLVTWLLHELVTRHVEWRIRFGFCPMGFEKLEENREADHHRDTETQRNTEKGNGSLVIGHWKRDGGSDGQASSGTGLCESGSKPPHSKALLSADSGTNGPPPTPSREGRGDQRPQSKARHPVVVHGWGVAIAQALTVGLYALVLWQLRWPVWAAQWPAAVGLDPHIRIGSLELAKSGLVAIPLNLLPFLLAMVASWVPRRRLSSRLRGRTIRLWDYLSYEARLTWLPLVLGVLLAVLADCAAMLPRSYTAWAETPGVDVLLLVTMILWVSLVALPQLIIWLWQCRPLPEGELRQRLTVLLQRSGVRAREIRVWGPRGSGLLNACVVGGWARHRYVLISPALVDELGMEETEAVLAHELGHARYGHLTFLLMMIVCLSLLLSFVTEFLPASVRASPAAEIGVMISFVGAYMYWFYGAMMRQCEREADLASAELIGTPAPLVRALERLGQIGGNVRAVWCWHHGSIAQRVAAVERLSQDAAASAEFHTQQARIRRWFLVLTVVAVAAEVYVRIRV